MAEKRKRGQNFTLDEKDKLVKLLLQHKSTILNKRTDGTTNEAKNNAWTEVTEMFNSSATVSRSKESLMKAWEKMKSESKHYYSQIKRNCLQTGGGIPDVKTNPILDQVCVILGRGCTGINGVPDSDSGPSSQIEEMDQIEIKDMVPMSIQDILVIPGTSSITVDPKIDFGDNSLQETVENSTQPPKEQDDGITIKSTPLWSRRRPQQQQHERTEAVSTLCNSYKDINKKKGDIEDLKRQLLLDEIDHKKKLYNIQLKAAEVDLRIKEVDLKIKEAVLKQVQGAGTQLLTNLNVTKNT